MPLIPIMLWSTLGFGAARVLSNPNGGASPLFGGSSISSDNDRKILTYGIAGFVGIVGGIMLIKAVKS